MIFLTLVAAHVEYRSVMQEHAAVALRFHVAMDRAIVNGMTSVKEGLYADKTIAGNLEIALAKKYLTLILTAA